MPATAKLAATAAPVPPLDPPGLKSVLYGFLVAPKAEPTVVMPNANSCIVVLPMMIAPAAFNRSTRCASRCGANPLNRADPLLVGMPTVS